MLGLTLLSIWGSSRLGFRLDLKDFLIDQPADESQIPPDILDARAGGDRFAILLEADDSIVTRDVERVFDHLAAALGTVPGVRRVEARVNVAERRFVEEDLPARIALYMAPGDLVAAGGLLSRSAMEAALLSHAAPGPRRFPRVPSLEKRDPLGLLRLAARPMRSWLGVARLRTIDGFLALPGGRTFILIVEPAGAFDDVREARRLVDSIEQVLQNTRSNPELAGALAGRRLSAVGQIVSRVSAVDELRADGIRVAAASAIAVVLLLGLLFRRLAAPVAITATVTLGLLITGTAALGLFGSVGLLAWVFTGLLVGLGDDFGISVCSQYWIHGEVDSDREAAVIAALARPGPALTTSAWTSAAGFFSLVLIPYPWAREVGVLTAVGLLVILACSLTVLPLLLSLFPPARRASPPAAAGGIDESAGRVRPLRAGLPWILLVGTALLLLPTIRFEAQPWPILVRGNREAARLDQLSREAGAAFTPIVIVSRGSTPEEALERDRDATRRLQAVSLRAGVAAIRSLAQWLPDPEDQRANLEYLQAHPDLFSQSRIRHDFTEVVARMETPDPNLTEEYLPRILAALDPSLTELGLADLRGLGLGAVVEDHLLAQGGASFAVSYVYLRQYPWAEGVMSRFMDVSRAAGLPGTGVTLSGAGIHAPDARVIRRGVIRATLLATVLVLGILWLRLGQLRLVVLCVAPLVCGLSATIIAMRLLDIEFNLLSAAIAPILVGIGVDDGVHIVARLRAGQDVTTAVRESSVSMIMATLTTVAAFACLGLAEFTGIAQVGVLGAVGLIGCLLGALNLVPLGWRVLEDKRPGAEAKPQFRVG